MKSFLVPFTPAPVRDPMDPTARWLLQATGLYLLSLGLAFLVVHFTP